MPDALREGGVRFALADACVRALNFSSGAFADPLPSHAHGAGCYEIHLVVSGRGRARIDGQTHALAVGALYVTGPGVEHAQFPLPEDPMCESCIYLQVEPRRVPAPDPGEAALLAAFTRRPRWIGRASPEVERLFAAIFAELPPRLVGGCFLVEALLRELLVHLARLYEDAAAPPPRPALAVSDRDALLIEEAFLYDYRDLTLPGLATRLRLSPRQTERLLRRLYGKSFREKKAEARFSAALLLLADPDRPLTEIAEALGYSSAEHFSSAFRRRFGVSPARFRRVP